MRAELRAPVQGYIGIFPNAATGLAFPSFSELGSIRPSFMLWWFAIPSDGGRLAVLGIGVGFFFCGW